MSSGSLTIGRAPFVEGIDGNAGFVSTVVGFSGSGQILLEIIAGSICATTATLASTRLAGGVYLLPPLAAAAANVGGVGFCGCWFRITPAYLSSSSTPESSTF